MEQNIYQYGAVAIIFLFSIKEFFAYLRSRRNNSNGKTQNNRQDDSIQRNDVGIARIEERLKSIEKNHLPSIEKELERNRTDHENIMSKFISIETLIKNETKK